ncbi:MAG: betaine--homocysteine S-methyltransferase [Acidimicrobiia bacterium]
MRTSLSELLASRDIVLADGATGTNYFAMGLSSGEPPELWNVDRPERVAALHQQFVDAGADIILTNSFGGTRQRLKLHKAEDRVFELAKRAAEIARGVADATARAVVVAGSVGPTGELFEPLGALTEDAAIASFTEQIEGLVAGGADVVWIETMSAVEEIRAAALAAIAVGVPYVATCSFDTAGRTMMGLMPDALAAVFEGLAVPPVALGANCGVGASDILVTVLSMGTIEHPAAVVSKGNCGIPQFKGSEIVYSGTPELMGAYATLAADAGARIVGGCCGTSPEHLAAMRRSLDERVPGVAPTVADIVDRIGPLTNAVPTASVPSEGRNRRNRRASA